jgi:hypothetical protein
MKTLWHPDPGGRTNLSSQPIESTDLTLLQRTANDEIIARYRIMDRNPIDAYDYDTGFILVEAEGNSPIIAGIGEDSTYDDRNRLMGELGLIQPTRGRSRLWFAVSKFLRLGSTKFASEPWS